MGGVTPPPHSTRGIIIIIHHHSTPYFFDYSEVRVACVSHNLVTRYIMYKRLLIKMQCRLAVKFLLGGQIWSVQHPPPPNLKYNYLYYK